MSGLLKKVAAVVAAKEIFERVQEARKPKRSFMSKMSPMAIIAGVGGAAFWAYKNGKLDPVVEQAKSLTGNGSDAHAGNGSYPTPAATSGVTATGATSTTSTI